MNPQLALRVAIIASCALVMFAVIFFRLWFLQVLSGDQYLKEASANISRTILIPPARGEIVDRNDKIMVDSTKVPSVLLAPPDLPLPITLAGLIARSDRPPARDARLFATLATILKIPMKRIRCHVDGKYPPPKGPEGNFQLTPIACAVAQQVALVPYDNVTIKSHVPNDVYYYLAERQRQFPGVTEQQVSARTYPLGDVAAQLFGTIGPISPAQVEEHQYKGVPKQSVIGQSGLEYQYDAYLRGQSGKESVQVNSLGQFKGYGTPTPSVSGDDLRLSIDLPLQEAGEASLEQSVSSTAGAIGGAFVALDPTNGQVLAMGSNPTYNPSIFTKPISTASYKALTNPDAGYPLINRAIQTAGPTGSTFKVITATAALSTPGIWSAGQTYDDNGQFCFPNTTLCLHNAGHAVDGVLNMENAFRVSSDDFFYNLGAKLNDNPLTHPNGGPLQDWARKFGIGESTGIDLPDASLGALPTPNYLKSLYKQELECENATGIYKNHPKHPASTGGCGIANNPDWTIGDNVNTAVGQGDVQVTPLQLAVVYSALANGGTIVRPHVGLDIQSSDGTVLRQIDPPPARHIAINPDYLDTIRAGLRAAASQPGGTSDDVMGNFPEQVYGKTGTAQYTGQNDYAWYACFVPATATSKPIVIVVTVERGGFGDAAAAPVARQMLSEWFLHKRGPFITGNSSTL